MTNKIHTSKDGAKLLYFEKELNHTDYQSLINDKGMKLEFMNFQEVEIT